MQEDPSSGGWLEKGMGCRVQQGSEDTRGQSEAVPLGSWPGLWSLHVGRGDVGGSSSSGDGSVSVLEGSPEP